MKKTFGKVRILANPSLFFGGLLSIIIIVTLSATTLLLLQQNIIRCATDKDRILTQLFIGMWAVIYLVGVILCAPQWFASIVFDKERIYVFIPFRKRILYEYKNFSHVYKATYWHGSLFGVGYHPQFFVLSQRRMTTDELQNVNHVPISDKVVKIRHTEHMHRKLCTILPEYHKGQLNKLFENL